MPYRINCPGCRQLLYLPNYDEDSLEIACPKCRHKYEVIVLEVIAFSSSIEPVSPSSPQYSPSFRRVYDLRGITPIDTLKTLQFSTSRTEERFSALRGDGVILLYPVRQCKSRGNLALIHNATTAQSHHFYFPGWTAIARGIESAVLTFGAGILLAAIASFPTTRLFWVVTVPSSLGVGVYVTKRQSLKRSDNEEYRRLVAEQQLLSKQHDLTQRCSQLDQEVITNQRLIRRLQDLQDKMRCAGESLYTHRIETTTRAIAILEQQIGLAEKLIDGYSQIAKLLEIEIEVFQITEQIPVGDSNEFFRQLDELKTIETQKEEMAILVDPQRLLNED